MKKIFLLLFLSAIILSGCAKKEAPPLKPGDISPFFRAYDKAKEVKKISEERSGEADEVLNE
jgi:hypothetical protein